MKKTLLLILLLVSAPAVVADGLSCNVDGKVLFNLIILDETSKVAMLTDGFGKDTQGKLTLVRDAGNGKKKFNISLEYKLDDTPIHFDLIIAPVAEDEYSIGIAGYSLNRKKQLLEIVSKDKAMCF